MWSEVFFSISSGFENSRKENQWDGVLLSVIEVTEMVGPPIGHVLHIPSKSWSIWVCGLTFVSNSISSQLFASADTPSPTLYTAVQSLRLLQEAVLPAVCLYSLLMWWIGCGSDPLLTPPKSFSNPSFNDNSLLYLAWGAKGNQKRSSYWFSPPSYFITGGVETFFSHKFRMPFPASQQFLLR